MTRLPERILDGIHRAYVIDYLVQSDKIKPTSPLERQLLCWVLPPWQRDAVWSEAQQVRFIEGIFLGLGAGYYVVHGPDFKEDATPLPMSGWLIDGQQRITAIDKFLKGELTIFDGVRYADIDRTTQLRRFLRTPFPCLEIPYQKNEAVLKTLYERLCFGGTPHSAADLERLGKDFVSHAPRSARP